MQNRYQLATAGLSMATSAYKANLLYVMETIRCLQRVWHTSREGLHFRTPGWDLLELQLLRPASSGLLCLYSTFHLEYPLVLSRFCLECKE